MFSKLFILFTVVPALEIYLLIEIGGKIGATNTFLVIILTGMLGAYYTRLCGFSVLTRFQQTVNEGRMPGQEIMDGAMLLVGGALLITPGFLTDFVGFSLLFPPIRDLIKSYILETIKRKIEQGDIEIHPL